MRLHDQALRKTESTDSPVVLRSRRHGMPSWKRVSVLLGLILFGSLGALWLHAGLGQVTFSNAPLRQTTGLTLPCPASFPSAVRCNSKKVIPVSDADMPLVRKPLHWDAVGPPPGGCCAWSDVYRFIFIRTPKAASTTVLSAFLRPAVCPLTPGERGVTAAHDNAGGRYAYSANCTAEHYSPLDSDCAPCATIPRWKWLHYFVFSAVRNPYVRAASSYSFCVRNRTQVPFAAFCVNPDAAGGCAWLPGAIAPPPDAPPVPNVHWSHQTAGLCGSEGCVVDWIARVESLGADLDSAVASINAMRSPGAPPLRPYSERPTHANQGGSSGGAAVEAAAQLYAQPANTHCAAAVASWYARDFELLGYAASLPVPR